MRVGLGIGVSVWRVLVVTGAGVDARGSKAHMWYPCWDIELLSPLGKGSQQPPLMAPRRHHISGGSRGPMPRHALLLPARMPPVGHAPNPNPNPNPPWGTHLMKMAFSYALQTHHQG